MQRKNYSPEYKTKIVIEVLEGDKMASEIAAREGLNPKILSMWKTEFLKNAHRAFGETSEEKQLKQEIKVGSERENELVTKVGVLTMENDWLKKKSKEVLGYEPTPKTYRQG